MISRVEVEVKDGGSGIGEQRISGVHAKVGISSKVTDPVEIRNTMDTDQIRELLGQSPLADACMDSIDGGAQQMYCYPVTATTGGKPSEVTHNGTGKVTVTVSGTGINAYDVIVRIVDGGATNEATFTTSTDGGNSVSEEMTVPLAGTYEIPDTGLTLTFEAASENKFVAGDTYAFTVAAPTTSNESILSAVERVYKSHANIEAVHIVGTTNKDLWASLEALAQAQETDAGRPLLIVCEQRAAGKDEAAADYVEAIEADCKSAGRHVAVVQTWARFKGMDGRVRVTNMAAYIMGMIAQAKESTSIAYVRDFAISESKVLELVPNGIEDMYEELDAARYIALRRYPGRDAWYLASSNTCAPESSDFATIEHARVMYRLVREVYKRATEWLKADFDASEIETEAAPVQADLNIPVEDAIKDQIISSGQAVLLDPESLLTAQKIPVRVSYKPRAYANVVSLTFMAGAVS